MQVACFIDPPMGTLDLTKAPSDMRRVDASRIDSVSDHLQWTFVSVTAKKVATNDLPWHLTERGFNCQWAVAYIQ